MAVTLASTPMNPLDIASHGPVIPVIVIDRVEDALPLAEALLAGGVKLLQACPPLKPLPATCPRPWWVWAPFSMPTMLVVPARPVHVLPSALATPQTWAMPARA